MAKKSKTVPRENKKKPKTIIIDPCISDDEDEGDVVQKPQVPITPLHMTMYEMVVVIDKRTKQLDNGNPPLIEVNGDYTNADIALMELRAGALDMSIVRMLPGGRKEVLHVRELALPLYYR